MVNVHNVTGKVDRFVSSTLVSYLQVTCDNRKTNILFIYILMKILFVS